MITCQRPAVCLQRRKVSSFQHQVIRRKCGLDVPILGQGIADQIGQFLVLFSEAAAIFYLLDPMFGDFFIFRIRLQVR